MSSQNGFLVRYKEKEDFNQYWYSQSTIEALVQELQSCCTRAAFLSTPSVYFSLPRDSSLRQESWVFDYDTQWSKEAHFCKYDFNAPEDVPSELHHTFDCVVIDPPFITEEVWNKYAATAKLLLKPEGKVVASTVAENAPLMDKLFSAKPLPFKPSIPHLVYQYNLFANFEPTTSLHVKNPEVPDDD